MAVLDTYCVATHSDAEGPASFDVVILGMGEDGHTASFFPDADNIVELVDPMSGSHLLSCNSPSTQVARVTWSLPRILSASFMVLHITGEKKKTVYQQALENDDATTLPIRAAIFQEAVRLNVYYAD
jgi:6-phosphogluconolactonase